MATLPPCPRCQASVPSNNLLCGACGLEFRTGHPRVWTFLTRGLQVSLVGFLVAIASLTALTVWGDSLTALHRAAGEYATVTRLAQRILELSLCVLGSVALLGTSYFWFNRERSRFVPSADARLPNRYRLWAWLAVSLVLLLAASFLWYTVSNGLTRLS